MPQKRIELLKNRMQNAKGTEIKCDVDVVRKTLNRIKFVEPLQPLFAQTFAKTMVMSASTLSYRSFSSVALVTPTRIQV